MDTKDNKPAPTNPPANDLTELRGHLFDTLRALKAKTIDMEDAKAINDTAQTIINSAKIEVDYLKATGKAEGSSIFESLPAPTALPKGVNGVTTHRLK